jgi:hypothetical protein
MTTARFQSILELFSESGHLAASLFVQEMEDEGEVRRTRKGSEAVGDILDEPEQQRIIDDLEGDYKRIVRTEKLMSGGICIVSTICLISLAFYTGLYYSFLASALAFLTMMAWLFQRRWVILVGSGALQLFSACIWWMESESLGRLVPMLIHIVYLIHGGLVLSSYRFITRFPERIEKLKGLKYGVKLA